MSAAFFISTETSSPAADQIAMNGKYFVLHIDNISSIGEDHGLRRLDEYIGYTLDEALGYANDSAHKEQSKENYQEEWFDPAEGHELISRYIEPINNYHSLSDTSK